MMFYECLMLMLMLCKSIYARLTPRVLQRKNSTACSDLIMEIGQASIHFVNLSMVTSRWVKLLGAFLNGPTRSSPQTAKGHVMGII